MLLPADDLLKRIRARFMARMDGSSEKMTLTAGRVLGVA
jgi:hypothetical protein